MIDYVHMHHHNSTVDHEFTVSRRCFHAIHSYLSPQIAGTFTYNIQGLIKHVFIYKTSVKLPWCFI